MKKEPEKKKKVLSKGEQAWEDFFKKFHEDLEAKKDKMKNTPPQILTPEEIKKRQEDLELHKKHVYWMYENAKFKEIRPGPPTEDDIMRALENGEGEKFGY